MTARVRVPGLGMVDIPFGHDTAHITLRCHSCHETMRIALPVPAEIMCVTRLVWSRLHRHGSRRIEFTIDEDGMVRP